MKLFLWGKRNEEVAKTKLKKLLAEQHMNPTILPAGLMIDRKFPFLGATPDGIIICECCGRSLLEIKCPARGKGKYISDIPTKNFFLDELLNLKVSHSYNDQIQGQMDIWGIQQCFLVTYTDLDIHVQIIEYDENSWYPKKAQLVSFYEKFVIPKIITDF